MIRTYYGLSNKPFAIDETQPLLEHKQRHLEILKVHSQQGGLCHIPGDPGTGKTVLKNALTRQDPKQWITPVINRSLHFWHNILRLLCHAFSPETDGSDHKCETRLIHEAKNLNAKDKLIIPIIDDAHLLPIEALGKLRLLLEDFPKNHNLVLIAQPALNTTLQLSVNHDIRSRVTYSAKLEQLTPQAITNYVHSQLDHVGLPHHTFTEQALNLIIRTSEGTLRAVKNLCIGSLIEAVRDRARTVDLKQVNAVLLLPTGGTTPNTNPSLTSSPPHLLTSSPPHLLTSSPPTTRPPPHRNTRIFRPNGRRLCWEATGQG